MQKIFAIALLIPVLIAHAVVGAAVGGYQAARSEIRMFMRIMKGTR